MSPPRTWLQRKLYRLGWYLIHRAAARTPVPRSFTLGQWLLWHAGANTDHRGRKRRWSQRLSGTEHSSNRDSR